MKKTNYFFLNLFFFYISYQTIIQPAAPPQNPHDQALQAFTNSVIHSNFSGLKALLATTQLELLDQKEKENLLNLALRLKNTEAQNKWHNRNYINAFCCNIITTFMCTAPEIALLGGSVANFYLNQADYATTGLFTGTGVIFLGINIGVYNCFSKPLLKTALPAGTTYEILRRKFKQII